MKELLYLIIDIFTSFSAFFRKLMLLMGIEMNDKQLHFIIIGLLCMMIFALVQVTFKKLARLSITILSFIYTLTVGIVIAFAIEIGQWKSGTGQMDFADIVYGIYGFVLFFVAFQLTVFIIKFMIKKYRRQPDPK